MGPGMGSGPGGGMTGVGHQGHHGHHGGAGAGAGYDQAYSGNTGGPGMTGTGYGNQQYDNQGSSGMAAGVADPNMGGGGGGQGIPSSQALHAQGGAAPRGGGGHSTTGKIEAAVGSMIGSQALKQKGLQKEAEAQNYKVQGSELQEAERLEREAKMRRERAVAHGAHPDNKHLGGINPNSGSNPGAMNQPGVGSGNYGGTAAGGAGGIY